LVAAICLTLLPAAIQAQGTLVGQVGDAIGNGLPGVIVEAAGVSTFDEGRMMQLTATADEHGHYQLDLPPGMYSVRFSLPGFGTVIHRHVGIEDACRISLDARLLPVDLYEGVTVTGVAPGVGDRSLADRLPPADPASVTPPSEATPLVERASRRNRWGLSIERQIFSKHITDACLGYAPMWLNHLDIVLKQRPCRVASVPVTRVWPGT